MLHVEALIFKTASVFISLNVLLVYLDGLNNQLRYDQSEYLSVLVCRSGCYCTVRVYYLHKICSMCVSLWGENKVEADCQQVVNWKKEGLLMCCLGTSYDAACRLNCWWIQRGEESFFFCWSLLHVFTPFTLFSSLWRMGCRLSLQSVYLYGVPVSP